MRAGRTGIRISQVRLRAEKLPVTASVNVRFVSPALRPLSGTAQLDPANIQK